MQTSVMIDAVIAAVFLVCAWLGWRKGLFRTLAELATAVIALFLAAQIAGAAAPFVVDETLRPAAHAAIEARVEELMEENSLTSSPLQELEQVLDAIPNPFVREKAGELLGGLDLSRETALSTGREALVGLGVQVVDMALDTVVLRAVHAAAYSIAFLVLMAVLRLLIRLLDTVLKLPIPFVGELNHAGGLLLGALKGAVLVGLGVWLLSRAGLVLTPEVLEKTRLAGLIAGLLGAEHPISL